MLRNLGTTMITHIPRALPYALLKTRTTHSVAAPELRGLRVNNFRHPVRTFKHLRPTNTQQKDTAIKIGFGDSGAGGAMFLIQSYIALCDFLIEQTSKYQVQFELIHVGDVTNAPYGGKSHEAIAELTKGFLGFLGDKGAQFAVIACNTASTTFDRRMNTALTARYPDMETLPIITATAENLLRVATISRTEKGMPQIHVGVLATRATTLSQKYPISLARLHSKRYGNEAYTVVINNDPFIKKKVGHDATFQFFRLYKGSTPVPRGTLEERDGFNLIRDHKCNQPVLFVHVHAPGEWVSIIERRDAYAKLSQDEWQRLLDKTVAEDVENFEKFAGSFYKDHTKEPLKVLSAIALACTHYPFVLKQIETTLQSMGVPAQIVAQGESFAQHVLVDKINRWMIEKEIQLREVPIPLDEIPKPRITSYTTVNQDRPDDVKAASELPNLCRIIDPKVGGQIIYKIIPPIQHPPARQ